MDYDTVGYKVILMHSNHQSVTINNNDLKVVLEITNTHNKFDEPVHHMYQQLINHCLL